MNGASISPTAGKGWHKGKSAAFVMMLVASLLWVFGASPAQAHTLNELAPSGASPWLYTQSWALTGYGYNTPPTHVDYYNGDHLSDNYALDMTPTGGLSSCGQPIYPIWDNMKVYAISSGTGGMYLRKTIGTQVYELKLLHMKNLKYGVGAVVGPTNVVGYSSNTGTTSCHLHVAVHKIVSGTRYAVRPVFCGYEVTVRNVGYRGC
ncbi:hypothetical protein ONA70_21865 [Micromonospora yasonensis]|uniref:hypothetical protein n=1 Tax=Micromonospora yasonensis TaxID=1128667 RepID=UPI0022311F39|nr:hypothetical protein [Micromonospora yasonensis]MCW3842751.1 hypothetical protein [Micromonospora yasonensis]